ncbi:MAG: trigger factor [Chlamydiales bacterium]
MADSNQKETTLGKQIFENDNLSVTVELAPSCTVKYFVQVKKSLALSSYEHAVKKIIKEASIPGFRKGKVPEELIMQRYKKPLDQEWQKELANRSFQECYSLTNIPLCNEDSTVSFQVKEHSKTHAELQLTFETEPVIPDIYISTLHIEKLTKKKISEQDIDTTIHRLQCFLATWKKVEERNVENGDFIHVDVFMTEETPPKAIFTNTRFEVTKEAMAEWMYDLVLNQPIGTSLEGISRPNDNISEEEKLKFPPKKVLVTIKSIERAILPELTDDFAQRFGAVDIADMRKKLFHLQENQQIEEARQSARDSIYKQLLEKYQFDLPPSLLKKEFAYRWNELIKNENFKSDWESKSESEQLEEQKKLLEEAQYAIRLFYIAKKILFDAGITVSKEDLHPSAQTPLEMLFTDPSLMQFDEKPKEEQAIILSRIMLKKASDYVINEIEKKEKKPSKKPTEKK